MRYKSFIFDLYGTLVDIHTEEGLPSLWEGLAKWYGERGATYSPRLLQERYFSMIREMESGEQLRRDSHEAHPEIKIEEVFLRLFREAGVDATLSDAVSAGETFRRLSLDYIRLYDGAEELLKTLRSLGGGVYLLSNAQAIFTRLELRELGITELFDAIYLSSDYGIKKPSRSFFELIIREQHIDIGSAVMIGNDGVCDIAGAHAVGLDTMYIRSNISPREPVPEADFVLESMDLSKALKLLTQ